jgi:hypothetical protein
MKTVLQLEIPTYLPGPLSGAIVTITFNDTTITQNTVSGFTSFSLPDAFQCDIQVEAIDHTTSRQTVTLKSSQIITVLLPTNGKNSLQFIVTYCSA